MVLLIVRRKACDDLSADVYSVASSMTVGVEKKSVMGYWFKRCLSHSLGKKRDGVAYRSGGSLLDDRDVTVYMAYTREPEGVLLIPTGFLIANGDVIELIIVNAAHRGGGVGSALLKEVIKDARNSCLLGGDPSGSHDNITGRRLTLEVKATNDRAISLYRRFGFRMVDARGDYIVMRMKG